MSCLAHTHEERLEILEAVAASKSHCDIIEYWKAFDFSCVNVDASVVNNLLQYIEESGIPVSMAISSLAREPLSIEEQKKNGVFYTDFRLAKFIADDCRDKISIESAVADFAAGTGILIVGIAEEYKKKLPQFFNKWVAHKLYAFDLSSIALRGATAALLSLTNDIDALKTMRLNWKTTDSLLNDDISNLKFDIIVGNPPWGKIKLSRHGFLTQNGEQRVYGAEYENFDHSDYEKTKESLSQYSKLIKQKYNLLGNAEPDMYMAFLQRVTESVVQGGHISYLVPAGLIRSQGTQVLRRYLFSNANRIEFDLLDNQANYFAIDTRFKFVLLSFDKNEHMSDLLKEFLFSMPTAASKNVTKGNPVCFSISQLEAARPDLTIPEVGSEEEKNLFFKVCENGQSWGQVDNVWFADISREVDMTNNRKHFVDSSQSNAIPVVEGRMVQQHRFGTKTYISGSGRSAKWAPCSSGGKSQFYYPLGTKDSQLTPLYLLDAKYKLVKNATTGEVERDDLYEAFAFCSATDTNEIVLVYPADDPANIPGHVKKCSTYYVKDVMIHVVQVAFGSIKEKGGIYAFSANLGIVENPIQDRLGNGAALIRIWMEPFIPVPRLVLCAEDHGSLKAKLY